MRAARGKDADFFAVAPLRRRNFDFPGVHPVKDKNNPDALHAFEIGEGAEMWAPMGRAVVGGMTVSFFLTLFIVPCVYVMMAGAVDRRRAKKSGQSPEAKAPVVQEKAAAAS